MSKWASEKQSRLAVALDPDRLGLLAGAVAALFVLIVSLFYRQTDLPTAILRSGIVLVVSYATIFILVFIVRRVTLTEVAIHIEEEQRKALERKQESNKDSGGTE